MYWLGPFEYKSKQELLEELKVYLMEAPPGRIADEVWVNKLRLLIDLHPDTERKVEIGIEYFFVKRNALGAGKGLRFIRLGGSEDGFSYKKCISGVGQSPHGKVCEALRFSVRDQMIEYRATVSLPVKCKIDGSIITRNADLHIDYEPPFWTLLKDFCASHDLSLSGLETMGNGGHLRLANEQVTTDFQVFHRLHATLQPTSKRANTAKGGRLQ